MTTNLPDAFASALASVVLYKSSSQPIRDRRLDAPAGAGPMMYTLIGPS